MKILVIGSVNIDEVNYIEKFPLAGETIVANKFLTFNGGKGANQAVAIKRLARDDSHQVFLFAKVGANNGGESAIYHLNQNGINTKYIFKSHIKPTGKATILISYLEKDNQIIVNKGANEDFDQQDLQNLEAAIYNCDLIALQLEVNEFLTTQALKIATKYQKIVIMNPAPAVGFKKEWLPLIDYFIPNKSELENIANQKLNNIEQIEKALGRLRKLGLKNAVVTIGNAGVYISTLTNKKYFEAKKAKVVDTTAAGDTFVGGFIVYCLLTNQDILQGMNNVLIAAALTVQKRGAQESIPTWKEVIREKNKAYQ